MDNSFNPGYSGMRFRIIDPTHATNFKYGDVVIVGARSTRTTWYKARHAYTNVSGTIDPPAQQEIR